MARFKFAPLSVLRVGAVLGSPIYDPRDSRIKLLGAGVAIDETLISRLRQRGVGKVVVNVSDLARLSAFKPQSSATRRPLGHKRVLSLMETSVSRELDEIIEEGESLSVSPEDAFEVAKPSNGRYDEGAMEEMAEKNEHRVNYLDGLFRDLVDSNSVSDTEPFDSICRDSLAMAARDIDQFVCLGANPFSSDYPHRHSLHVANLAIAIGTKMGLGEQSLLDLARGCLIHDIGMLVIPNEPHKVRRRFTDREIERIADHPLRTLELIESHIHSLPFASRMVAYQLHERCNGSGYPRGRKGNQIHELSKIAAVADAFVALAAKRPHRDGLQPYHVMVNMLQDVKHGLFDSSAVRGLLRAVSMFPIGSYVQTNDGRVGRVIRSNGDSYHRPILELWDEHDVEQASVVNLLENPNLKVVRSLAELAV